MVIQNNQNLLRRFLQISSNTHLLFLSGIYASISLMLYWRYGVRLSVDSPVYINAADELLRGRFPPTHELWYITYIGFLAWLTFFSSSLKAVVFMQFLLGLIAVWAFYKWVYRISNDNRSCAFIASILFTAWVKISVWHNFIYTESLYTSLVVIGLYLVSIREKSLFQWLCTSIIILFAIFTRPAGIVFFLACAGTVLALLPRFVLIVAALFVIPAFFWMVNYMLQDFILIESYARAEVIYPGISFFNAPSPLFIPPKEFSPLYRFVLFALHQPGYLLKLAVYKSFFFWGNVKPYFSFGHNLVVVLVLWPCYLFSGIGLWRGNMAFLWKTWCLLFLAGNGIMVAFTSENWDGRFLVPVLPVVFALAAIGWTKVGTSASLKSAIHL